MKEMMLRFLYILLLWPCLSTQGTKNALLIIADDGGFEAGVFGNQVIRTPNLDALGRSSLRFDNAFASVSSCSPSRSTILTGLPIHQNGMYGLHQSVHHFNSFDQVKTLPNILRKHSIRTGIIGKKHVGPKANFRFDYEETEENNHINMVGRNITHIAGLAETFIKDSMAVNQSFFLYIAFHDPHRCGHTSPELGAFCERYGNGEPGNGVIPDWNPQYYNPSEVIVPEFIPDTPAAREDLAAQYTTISRLDQGVGLLLKLLQKHGLDKNTLLLYSSDNGIPFPNGRTNFYDSGTKEPFLISSPLHKSSHGKSTPVLATLLDITPTLLDWFDVTYPKYHIFDKKKPVRLTGQSLLRIMDDGKDGEPKSIFGSHNLHEATMYYPMRLVRTKRFKLIHNLNYYSPFPIDQDLFVSPTFQDLLQRSRDGCPLGWSKNLTIYYRRPEWELFDLKKDPQELNNLVFKPQYSKLFLKLQKRLFQWQRKTDDPWICSPHGVLEDKGAYADDPQCLWLQN